MDRVDRKIQSYLYQITFLSFPLARVHSPFVDAIAVVEPTFVFIFIHHVYVYTTHTDWNTI